MNEEEAEEVKKQILQQLENSETENKEEIKEAIKAMNDEELEEFLKQNKLVRETKKEGNECVFCLILQGKVPSYKLDENKRSMAILEINPLSKGHSIVISRQHNKLPSSAFTLANKLARRLKSKLKADEVKIENVKVLGHELIQVIPLYKDVKLEKRKADEKELIELQNKLKSKLRKKREKIQITPVLEKAPKRIP